MRSRWNPPRGCFLAASFLHPVHVLHLQIAHRLDCRLLARVPLAVVRATRLDALPPTANLCPVCIAPARRDPARVRPRELATPSPVLTNVAHGEEGPR